MCIPVGSMINKPCCERTIVAVDILCSIFEYRCQYLMVPSHVSKAMLSNKDKVLDVFLTVCVRW